MTRYEYPLATSSWDSDEYESIQRVIDSGMFSMGLEVQTFEAEFASYFGSKYAVMSNSGSSANLLMVAALFYTKTNPLQPGDEVIVPAVSWSTTYYPLHQYGLKLKFVDIDLETLNYDIRQLEAAISDKTRLIMAVNLLGNPNDFDQIKRMVFKRNIYVIEDNCESMGAEYCGKMAGTFGVMGSFSSFFSHHISTMEGGITITDNEELYHIMLSLRAHGWTRNLPDKNLVCGDKSTNPFEESFRFVLPGYNLRPLEFSGAIGRVQLKKLTEILDGRRENAKKFIEIIKNKKSFSFQKEIGKSSWFGFAIMLTNQSNVSRKQVLEIFRECGIDVRPIVAGNFVKNEVTQYFNYEVHEKLVNADYVDKNGFFIGNHHYQMIDEFIALEKALEKFE